MNDDLLRAFASCISGRGTLHEWQLIHRALFGAPFRIALGNPEDKEKADEPDQSTSP